MRSIKLSVVVSPFRSSFHHYPHLSFTTPPSTTNDQYFLGSLCLPLLVQRLCSATNPTSRWVLLSMVTSCPMLTVFEQDTISDSGSSTCYISDSDTEYDPYPYAHTSPKKGFISSFATATPTPAHSIDAERAALFFLNAKGRTSSVITLFQGKAPGKLDFVRPYPRSSSLSSG